MNKHAVEQRELWTTTMDSPVGVLTLVASDEALCELSWGAGPKDGWSKFSLADTAIPDPSHPILVQAVRELAEYFAGTRRTFDVAVVTAGTKFQQSVWMALRGIPYGDTISYGEQARRIGNPSAMRAVGGANGRNPVAIIVPCHRVIGADGSLTGFGGGMDAKSWLLHHEQSVRETASPTGLG